MLNIRNFSNILIIIISISFGIKFYYLSNGNVLNFYPLISPDGFDWYTEGAYLYNHILHESLLPLNVLRPPFFVILTSLDYMLGERGLILALSYSLSFVVTYFSIIWIIENKNKNKNKNKNAWYLIAVLIAVTFHPINFHKAYLLADSIGVSLSLLSIVFFISFQNYKNYKYFFSAFIFALMGGLTQTYAAIPFIIFVSIYILYNLLTIKKDIFFPTLYLLIFIATYLIIIISWRDFIPHSVTPKNFTLLKFNLNMTTFYLNVWLYYFAPFILFVVLAKNQITFIKKIDRVNLSLFFIILSVALLCFFYQWTDARFSYILWPWAIIFFFKTVKPKNNRKGFILILILFLLSSSLVPGSFWGPRVFDLSLNAKKNWFVEYMTMNHTNRKFETCRSHNCENSFIENSDNYVKGTMSKYFYLKHDLKANTKD